MWQLPRQPAFGGIEAVADAKRYVQAAQNYLPTQNRARKACQPAPDSAAKSGTQVFIAAKPPCTSFR